MAGRTFRQTRPSIQRDANRIIVTDEAGAGTTGIVQQKDAGETGTNRITFEPVADQQQPINIINSDTSSDDSDAVDPNTISDRSEPPSRQRRQRADKGQIRKPRGSLAQSSNLEKLMLSMHMMGAAFLHIPELRIDEQEAAILTKATTDLFKAYGIPEMTEKQLALGQALMAAGTVYGPRIIVVMNRKNQRPKLVPPIPFPSTNAVQETMQSVVTPAPPIQQAPANVTGAAPIQPPAPAEQFVSSQVLAGDFGNSLETVGLS